MWTTKPNGDVTVSIVGGFIDINIQYVYTNHPGYRVIAVGARNIVFPDIYNDVQDAKKDAEAYIKKVFEQFHAEVSAMNFTTKDSNKKGKK